MSSSRAPFTYWCMFFPGGTVSGERPSLSRSEAPKANAHAEPRTGDATEQHGKEKPPPHASAADAATRATREAEGGRPCSTATQLVAAAHRRPLRPRKPAEGRQKRREHQRQRGCWKSCAASRITTSEASLSQTSGSWSEMALRIPTGCSHSNQCLLLPEQCQKGTRLPVLTCRLRI